MRRHGPLLVVGAALLAVVAPAHGEPPALSAKRAEAARVLAEARALDVRLERSVEAYNLARIRLERTARSLAENGHRLGIARRNLLRAHRQHEARVALLYRGEERASPLAVFLGATNLSGLLDRLDTARFVAEQDARVLDEVTAFREQVATRQRELRAARESQERIAGELAAQRGRIEEQLAERAALLSSVRDEIARLEARERERQTRLRREARARLEAQAAAARAAVAEPEPILGVAAITPEGVGIAPDSRHGYVVEIAMRYLGIPYRWGGASPSEGFDCSGFVLYVYAQVGVSLPHNAAMQYGYGVPVAKEDLQAGDIVFFNNLGHNGIYIGGGQFIQAPRTGDVVKISSLSESWYASTYYGARRLP